MPQRWTMAELDSMSDQDILRALLSERLAGLSNHYTPLAVRLKKIRDRLERMARRRNERQIARDIAQESTAATPAKAVRVRSV